MDEQPMHPGWGVVAGPQPRQQRGVGPTYRRSAPDEAFGAVLARALTGAGLTQSALARRIDVDPTLISGMVTGIRRPSMWMLARLVEELPAARKRLIEAALATATRKSEGL